MNRRKDLMWKGAALLGLLVTAMTWLFGQGGGRAAPEEPEPVRAIALGADGRIWIGTSRSLYTIDAEGALTPVDFKGGVRQLLADPGNPSNLYAVSEDGRLFRTRDGGRTWGPTRSEGLPEGAAIRTATLDPSGPRRVAAIVAGHGYFQSENAGLVWRHLGTQDIPGATAMAMHPLNARTILVGASDGLYRSHNQGLRFSIVRPDLPWELKGAVHSLAVAGNRSTMVAATAGGLFRSTDGGRSWHSLGSPGLPDTVAVAIDPWRPQVIAAGSSNGAVVITRDGGSTWQQLQ